MQNVKSQPSNQVEEPHLFVLCVISHINVDQRHALKHIFT